MKMRALLLLVLVLVMQPCEGLLNAVRAIENSVKRYMERSQVDAMFTEGGSKDLSDFFARCKEGTEGPASVMAQVDYLVGYAGRELVRGSLQPQETRCYLEVLQGSLETFDGSLHEKLNFARLLNEEWQSSSRSNYLDLVSKSSKVQAQMDWIQHIREFLSKIGPSPQEVLQNPSFGLAWTYIQVLFQFKGVCMQIQDNMDVILELGQEQVLHDIPELSTSLNEMVYGELFSTFSDTLNVYGELGKANTASKLSVRHPHLCESLMSEDVARTLKSVQRQIRLVNNVLQEAAAQTRQDAERADLSMSDLMISQMLEAYQSVQDAALAAALGAESMMDN